MATVVKRKLSGSTDGKGIKIVNTVLASADTIHTAVAGTTAGTYDEVWIYVVNTSASEVKFTLCWWGLTDIDNTIEYTVAAEDGLKMIIPGLILQNGLVVKWFAATANVLVVYGFVNNMITG